MDKPNKPLSERMSVAYKPNQFHIPLLELLLELGKSPQFGSAYWSEIRRMREENCPFIAYPAVEVNFTMCGLGLEVGCDTSEA